MTENLAALVDGADLIICTAPAHTHRAVATNLAPFLQPGQIVMLNPGRTCGALEVRRVIADHGGPAEPVVVEAQTLVYACRRSGTGVHIFGLKEKVVCAGFGNLEKFYEIIREPMPQFVPAEQGIWETSLDNIGMLFHPTPTLMNLGRMESGQPFDYYIDGMTPSIAFLVEKLDAERCAVAEAMGIRIPTAVEWLRNSYGAEGSSLYEAVKSNRSYVGITAPQLDGIDAKKGLRYVIEDVPSGLVPISDLGKKFGVATPSIDLIIELANTLYEADFRSSGRTLDRLGLAEMSAEEIRNL